MLECYYQFMANTHCYLLKNNHQLVLPDDYLSMLNPTQVKRTHSMSKKRLHEFFFSRQLLNFAVTHLKPNIEYQINEQENHSPDIKLINNHSINCSISHCPTWLGIIISVDTQNIGIDLESIRSNWNIEKAKLFCSERQIQFAFDMKNSFERNRELTKIWTQKEALFKANGKPIFDKSIELMESSNTTYSLTSKSLENNTIMSIYSEHKAQLKITELDFNQTDLYK